MRNGCIAVAAALALVIGGFVVLGSLAKRGDSTPGQAERAAVGEDATVTLGTGEKVMACRTAEGLDEFYRLSNAGDTLGIAQLALSGRCALLEDSTLVRVIDRGIGTRQVRVLEGPLIGESWWTSEEWLRPVKPAPAP